MGPGLRVRTGDPHAASCTEMQGVRVPMPERRSALLAEAELGKRGRWYGAVEEGEAAGGDDDEAGEADGGGGDAEEEGGAVGGVAPVVPHCLRVRCPQPEARCKRDGTSEVK